MVSDLVNTSIKSGAVSDVDRRKQFKYAYLKIFSLKVPDYVEQVVKMLGAK